MQQHKSARTGGTKDQVLILNVAPETAELCARSAIEAAATIDATIEEAPEQFAREGADLLSRTLDRACLAAVDQLGRASQVSAVALMGLCAIPAPPAIDPAAVDSRELKGHDLLLAGVMHLAGTEPTFIPMQNHGQVARTVSPKPRGPDLGGSHGTKTFNWHQDSPWHRAEGDGPMEPGTPTMPAQLAIEAMRNEELTPTIVLTVDDLLREVPQSIQDQLRRAAFRIAPPDPAFGGEKALRPILYDRDGRDMLRFDPYLARAEDQDAIEAIFTLGLALGKAAPRAVPITLDAGSVLIFDNRRIMHMRPAFSPLEPGRQRWLRSFYGRGVPVHTRAWRMFLDTGLKYIGQKMMPAQVPGVFRLPAPTKR